MITLLLSHDEYQAKLRDEILPPSLCHACKSPTCVCSELESDFLDGTQEEADELSLYDTDLIELWEL